MGNIFSRGSSQTYSVSDESKEKPSAEEANKNADEKAATEEPAALTPAGDNAEQVTTQKSTPAIRCVRVDRA